MYKSEKSEEKCRLFDFQTRQEAHTSHTRTTRIRQQTKINEEKNGKSKKIGKSNAYFGPGTDLGSGIPQYKRRTLLRFASSDL